MKLIKFFLTGILFGVVLSKGEIISWYRIYEMFQFDSFHMFGVIGSSVMLGSLALLIIKRRRIVGTKGKIIEIEAKEKSFSRYIIGGSIFGMGWAMIGACPGPMFILLGNGFFTIGIVIIGAMIGTLLYGVLKSKLPH